MKENSNLTNKAIFSLYHLIPLLCTLFILNDYKVINLYDSQGYLQDFGDDAYEYISTRKFTQKKPDSNIEIILTQDADISIFPGQENKALDTLYRDILRDKIGRDYTDKETSETEFISYQEVREEYCTSIHADFSASRYALSTALENVLSQQPKLVVLDYLFIGESTHCPEYDEKLRNIIEKNNHVIVAASSVAKGNQTNDIQNVNPKKYIHKSIKKAHPDSNVHDSMIYPFFKDLYLKNPNLNNMGSGNSIVDSRNITQARLWVESENYSIPTIAVLAGNVLGRNLNQEKANISWRDGLYDHVSISSVANPINTNKSDFKDKVVLFGSSLSGKSADKLYTPIKEEAIAGVYVQATIIDNIINNDFIQRVSKWWSIGITLFLLIYVYISFFGRVASLHPKEILFGKIFRSKIVKNMHQWLDFDIDLLDIFLLIEILVIGISWIILHNINIYVDIVGPVAIMGLVFSIMAFMDFFAMKIFITKKSLLNNIDYKKIHFVKLVHDCDKVIQQQKESICEKYDNQITMIEFFPFNEDDIFGSHTSVNYFWWLSDKDISEIEFEANIIVHKIKEKTELKVVLNKLFQCSEESF